jgi:hypothetical protein
MPATVVTRAIGETTPPTRSESLFCDVYEPRTGKVVPANLCSTARPPQAENCGDSHPRRFAERESPYPHFRAKIVSRHPLAKRAQAVLSEPKRAQADDFTFWSSNPPPIEGNTPDLPEKNRNPLRCWTSTTCINSSAFMRAKPPDPVALTAPCLQVAVALERVARRTSAVARDCPDASGLYRRLVVGKATEGRGTRLTRPAFSSKSKILLILPHPPTPGWTYAVHVIFATGQFLILSYRAVPRAVKEMMQIATSPAFLRVSRMG